MSLLDFRSKNLQKLHHAKQIWEGQSRANTESAREETASSKKPQKKHKSKKENNSASSYDALYPYAGLAHGSDYNDKEAFFKACAEGDVKYLSLALDEFPELLEKSRGVLHRVCWEGHYSTLQALLKRCPKWIIDEAHGIYDKATPLIECARGIKGEEKWRVECFHALLRKGADIMKTDSNSNTCLHWAVRSGNLALTWFILSSTDLSTVLLQARDMRGRLPSELVKSQGLINYTKGRLNEMLSRAQEGSLVRERLQRRCLEAAEGRRLRLLALEERRESVLDEICASFERSAAAVREQHLTAEKTRQRDEDAFVSAAVDKATQEAIENMDHSALKTLTAQIREDLKQKVRSGAYEGKKPQNISTLAKRRAEQLIIRRKQRDASDRATIEFRQEHPVIDVQEIMRKLSK